MFSSQWWVWRSFTIVIFLWAFGGSALVAASNKAVDVYAAYESSVYQVKIIEIASGSQNSLGTGFVVMEGNVLATNYHVISAKVFEPEKYRIEIERDNQKIVLDILAVDVVSDLAIVAPVASKINLGKPFDLQLELPEKGETLYSLGNPHDLGMTVVEGTFNGLVEHRFTEQIHFSGPINSGMSGGPVVSDEARVVGVNVATSGNQIGFLVPVKALYQLIQRYQQYLQSKEQEAGQGHTYEATKTLDSQTPIEASLLAVLPTRADFPDKTDALLKSIGQQITSHTTAMIDAAIDSHWSVNAMAEATVKSSDLPWLECWGDSNKNKKLKINTISRGCHSGSNVYLGAQFNSGFIEYEFLYFEAKLWPSYSAYQYLARDTANAMPANRGPKKQLGAYQCVNREVVNQYHVTSRVSYCLRGYKKFENVYDAFYMAVSVDKEKQAVMSHFTLSGVTKDLAQRFLTHFLEVVAWP
ncbi:S1 family peptidase [Marinagarivorans algicola]|uniref:S1 family peptidase n=1 Tax=Marinagarivorans algicola TaxID=1513270 RepID=UPI0006B8A664|nr:serine protease [Marinagarivorans algicola]